MLLGHPKLTIAAVHGAAIGGGCGLATACDLVVTEPRSLFAYTEVTIGYVPALVLTFLTRRVPGNVARRLLLDPERVSGERAMELGLVDELVDEGQAMDRARELAVSIAQKCSPAAIAATKSLLNEILRDELARRPRLRRRGQRVAPAPSGVRPGCDNLSRGEANPRLVEE